MSLSEGLAGFEAEATAHSSHRRALEARVKALEALCADVAKGSLHVMGRQIPAHLLEQLKAAGRGEE